MAKDQNTSNLGQIVMNGEEIFLGFGGAERTEVLPAGIDGSVIDGVFVATGDMASVASLGRKVKLPKTMRAREAFLKKWAEKASDKAKANKGLSATLLILPLAACGGGGGGDAPAPAFEVSVAGNDISFANLVDSTIRIIDIATGAIGFSSGAGASQETDVAAVSAGLTDKDVVVSAGQTLAVDLDQVQDADVEGVSVSGAGNIVITASDAQIGANNQVLVKVDLQGGSLTFDLPADDNDLLVLKAGSTIDLSGGTLTVDDGTVDARLANIVNADSIGNIVVNSRLLLTSDQFASIDGTVNTEGSGIVEIVADDADDINQILANKDALADADLTVIITATTAAARDALEQADQDGDFAGLSQPIGIIIDGVTADNIVNIAEAAGDITISGSILNYVPADGAISVTVTLGARVSNEIIVNNDGSWTVTFNAAGVNATSISSVNVVAERGGVVLQEVDFAYSVDAVAPTVVSVEASGALNTTEGSVDLIINEADAGDKSLTVVVTYSEAMDKATAPTMAFTPSVASTLSFDNGSWNEAGTVYTAQFDVLDANISEADIDVVVSGARDLVGNTQVANEETDAFTIDTVAPTASLANTGAGDVINSGESVGSVVSVTSESGSDWTLTLTGTDGTVTKTGTGTGAAQDVALTAGDVTTLGQGAVTASVTATDAAGNATTASTGGNFTLDTVAPSAALANTVAGSVVNGAESTAAAGVVSVTAEAGATWSLTLTGTGGTVTKTGTGTGAAQDVALTAGDVTTLGQGAVSASVTATDAAGNATTASTGGDFTLDTVAPSAALANTVAGSVVNGAESTAAAGVVSVTAETGATWSLTLTGTGGTVTKTGTGTGAAQDVALTAGDVTTLGQGAVSASVTATDAAGNATTASTGGDFTLDTVAPSAALANTVAGSVVNGAESTAAAGVVSVTAETGATWSLTLTGTDGTVTKTGTGTGAAQDVALTAGDVTTLGQGAVTASVTATDAAGNATTASTGGNFTLDTVAPSAALANTVAGSVVNGAESTAAAGVVSVTAETGATWSLTLTGTDGTVTKTGTGTGAAQDVALTAGDITTLGQGAVTASVTATDAAGNAATASTGGNFTLDTVAPSAALANTVAGAVVNGAESTAAAGVVSVTAETGATWSLTLTGTDGTVTKTGTGTGAAQDVALTAGDITTLGQGAVSASVTATDAAGNATTASTGGNFTLDTVAPTATITLSNTALKDTGADATTVTITFSEAVTNFDWANVNVPGNGTLTGHSDNGLVYTAVFTTNADVNDSTNVITLDAGFTDAAGNAGVLSSSPNFTIDSDVQGSWANFIAGAVSIDGGDADNKLTIDAVPTGVEFDDNLTALQNISGVESVEFVLDNAASVDFGLSTNAAAAGFEEVEFSGNYTDLELSVSGVDRALDINLGNGSNTLVGTDFADTISTGNGDDYIDARGGTLVTKTINTGNGSDTVLSGNGSDVITLGAGLKDVNAGAGADTIKVAESEIADDTIVGGDGDDTIEFATSGAIADVDFTNVTLTEKVQLADGTDLAGFENSIELAGTAAGAGIVSVVGGANDDQIDVQNYVGDINIDTGNGTNEVLFSIDGLTSGDTVKGGTGTDTIALTTAGTLDDVDLTNVSSIEVLDLANGVNTISLGVEAQQAGIVSVNGDDGADAINASGYTAAININAGNGDNLVTGGSAADVITTGTGDDTISGGLGADNINAGSGTNVVNNAGQGLDSITHDAGGSVTVKVNDSDEVTLTATTAGATVDSAAGANTNVNASTSNTGVILNGNDGLDTFVGGTGDDTITGGADTDSLSGGAGSDLFTVAQSSHLTASEIISGGENAAGVDTLRLDGAGVYGNTQLDASLDGIEVVELNDDATNWSLTFANDAFANTDHSGGGVLDNIIEVRSTAQASVFNTNIDGSAAESGSHLIIDGTNLVGDDTLTGGADNDTISGGAGNDIITGGAGTDNLSGDAGDDVFVIAENAHLDAGETIDGGANIGGVDTLRLDEAGAYVAAQLDGTLSGVEVVELSDNSADWDLTFSDSAFGNADIDGNGAADGTMRVQSDAVLSVNVNIDANAVQAGNEIVVDGTNFGGNDTLIGGAGDDTISGGAGDDIITGGAGTEVLSGGDGYDVFVIAQSSDLTAAEAISGGANRGPDISNLVDGATIDLSVAGNVVSVSGYAAGETVSVDIEGQTISITEDFANTGFAASNEGIAAQLAAAIEAAGIEDISVSVAGSNVTLAKAGAVDTLRLDGVGSYGNTQLDGSLNGIEVVQLNDTGAGWDLTFADDAFSNSDIDGDGAADATIRVESAQALSDGIMIDASAVIVTANELVVDGANLGGNDTLYGGDGNDTITGGEGNDVIEGNGGADRIVLSGNDTVAGGGNDRVVFSDISDSRATNSTTPSFDTVVDFDFQNGVSGRDLFDLPLRSSDMQFSKFVGTSGITADLDTFASTLEAYGNLNDADIMRVNKTDVALLEVTSGTAQGYYVVVNSGLNAGFSASSDMVFKLEFDEIDAATSLSHFGVGSFFYDANEEPLSFVAPNNFSVVTATGAFSPSVDYSSAAVAFAAGKRDIYGNDYFDDIIDASDEATLITFNFDTGTLSGSSDVYVNSATGLSYVNFDGFRAGRSGSDVTFSDGTESVWGGDGNDVIRVNSLTLTGSIDAAAESIVATGEARVVTPDSVTAAVQNGNDISSLNAGLAPGVAELELTSTNGGARMTATQLAHFGSGSNDIIASNGTNKIVVATGDISTSITLDSDIEHLVLEDDTGNDQFTVVLEDPTSGSVTVESLSANDLITIDASNVVAPNTVHLLAAAGAKFIVTGLAANLDASNVTVGPVGREAGNNAPAVFTGGYGVQITVADQPSAGGDAFSITTGPVNTLITMPATAGYTDGLDTITVNAGLLPDTAILKLDGGANVVVAGVDSAIELLAGGGTLTGTLAVNIVDDGAADSIAVQTGTNNTTINGADEDDLITVAADALVNNNTLTLDGDADVVVNALVGNLDAGTGNLTGTLNVTTADNTVDNSISISTGSAETTVFGSHGSDTIVIDANVLVDNVTLTLNGVSEVEVDNIEGNINAASLFGMLDVDTSDATDNAISVITGSNATTVSGADVSDTVTINAEVLADNTLLTTDGTANITVNNLLGNMNNSATGTVQVNLDRDSLTAGTATTTITSSTAISIDADGTAGEGFADNDTVTLAGAGAKTVTALEANLTAAGSSGTVNIDTKDVADNALSITTGSGNMTVTGAASNDVITVTATQLADGGSLVLDGTTSGVFVDGLQGTVDASALTGTLDVDAANAGDNAISVITGVNATTVSGAHSSDTITIDADLIADNVVLTLDGGANIVVNALVGNIAATNLTGGTLNVTTAENTDDNAISITTGMLSTSVAGSGTNDTVTIDADIMADDTTLTTSGSSDVTVTGLMADMVNTATGTVTVTLDDDEADASSTITTRVTNNAATTVTVNNGTFDDGDEIELAGTGNFDVDGVIADVDAALLTGTLDVATVLDATDNAILVTTGNNNTTVTGAEVGDTVTINAELMDDNDLLTTAGVSNITVNNLMADMVNTATGTVTVTLDDDEADASSTITTRVTNNAATTVTVNNGTFDDGDEIELAGTGNFDVDGVIADVDAALLTGTLDVATVLDATDNAILVTTGNNNTTVTGAEVGDTVTINAELMDDNDLLTTAGVSNITVNNLMADMVNTATGTVTVTLDDDEADASSTITTRVTNNAATTMTVNNGTFDDGDEIELAGTGNFDVDGVIADVDAALLTGTLDVATVLDATDNAILVTTGNNSTTVSTAAGTDTVTIDADIMADDTTLTTSGSSDVTVTGLMADMVNTATGTVTVTLDDDEADASSTITTRVTNNAATTVTVNNGTFDDGDEIELAGTGNFDVDGVIADVDAALLTGTLDVATVLDATDNAILVTTGNNNTTVTGAEVGDTVTINAELMDDNDLLTTAGVSNITVNNLMADMVNTATGTVTVTLDDDEADASSTITTRVTNNAATTVTVNNGTFDDGDEIELAGTGNFDVDGVIADVDAALLTGTLDVATVLDATDNAILVTTGNNNTTVTGAEVGDTVTINAELMDDNDLLTTAGVSNITVNNLMADMVNTATGTVTVTLDDDEADASSTITTRVTNNAATTVTVNNGTFDDGDEIELAGTGNFDVDGVIADVDAALLTGTLDVATVLDATDNAILVTTGNNSTTVSTAAGTDTVTIDADIMADDTTLTTSGSSDVTVTGLMADMVNTATGTVTVTLDDDEADASSTITTRVTNNAATTVTVNNGTFDDGDEIELAGTGNFDVDGVIADVDAALLTGTLDVATVLDATDNAILVTTGNNNTTVTGAEVGDTVTINAELMDDNDLLTTAGVSNITVNNLMADMVNTATGTVTVTLDDDEADASSTITTRVTNNAATTVTVNNGTFDDGDEIELAGTGNFDVDGVIADVDAALLTGTLDVATVLDATDNAILVTTGNNSTTVSTAAGTDTVTIDADIMADDTTLTTSGSSDVTVTGLMADMVNTATGTVTVTLDDDEADASSTITTRVTNNAATTVTVNNGTFDDGDEIELAGTGNFDVDGVIADVDAALLTGTLDVATVLDATDNAILVTTGNNSTTVSTAAGTDTVTIDADIMADDTTLTTSGSSDVTVTGLMADMVNTATGTVTVTLDDDEADASSTITTRVTNNAATTVTVNNGTFDDGDEIELAGTGNFDVDGVIADVDAALLTGTLDVATVLDATDNAILVTTGNNNTTVTGAEVGDTVTINAELMDDNDLLTTAGVSNITVNNLMADMVNTATGTVTVTLDDDEADASSTITTRVTNNAATTVTVNNGTFDDGDEIELAGTGNFDVDGVIADVDAALLTGTLDVATVLDATDNAILVTTGNNNTTVTGAEVGDTVTINAELMDDNDLLTTAGVSNITVNNLMADMVNTATGTVTVTLDDDEADASSTITTRVTNNAATTVTVNNGTFDDGDEIELAGTGNFDVDGVIADVDAALLTGTLDVATVLDATDNAILVTTGNNSTTVSTAAGTDTVTIDADIMADDTTLTTSGSSDVTVTGLMADMVNTATGTVTVTLDDDEADASSTITTRVTNNAATTVTVNNGTFDDGDEIELAGTGNFDVDGVIADVDAALLTGTLDVATVLDATDNAILVTTGNNSTTVSTAAGTDTVTIDADIMADDTTLTTSGSSDVTVTGLMADMVNTATGTVTVTLDDDEADASSTITTRVTNNAATTVTVNNGTFDDGDEIELAGTGNFDVDGVIADVDAALLTGTLDVATVLDATDNAILVTTGNNNTTVTGAEVGDTVTINAELMDDNDLLTTAGVSNITVNNLMADMVNTATGTVTVTLDDDEADASSTITTRVTNNAATTVTVNNGTFDDGDEIELAGTGNFDVDGVIADVDAALLTGTLDVATVLDATDNAILVTTGNNNTTVTGAEVGDTVTINAELMDDNDLLTTAGVSNITVNNLMADMVNTATGTVTVTLDDDEADASSTITTRVTNNAATTVTVNNGTFDDGDEIELAGTGNFDVDGVIADVDAALLTGTLDVATVLDATDNAILVTTGNNSTTVSTAAGTDTVTIDADIMADDTTLTTSGSSDVTVTGLMADMVNSAATTVSITLEDDETDATSTITTRITNNAATTATVANGTFDDGDTIELAGNAGGNFTLTDILADVDASVGAGLAGTLAVTLGSGANVSVTGGNNSDTVNISTGNDTLTVTAIERINGNIGNDTITVTDDVLEFIDLIDGTNSLTFEVGNAVDDHTVTGGSGVDTVKAELNANLTLTFDNADLSEIETVEITDIDSDNSGTPWTANVTITGNFNNGQAITFDASSLDAGEVFTFDARAYNTGGAVVASDAITAKGGAGDDVFYTADLDEERGVLTFDLSSGGTDTIHIRNDDWNGSYTLGTSGDGSYGLSDGFFVVSGSNGFGVTVTSFASGNGGDLVDITYDVTGAVHPDAATAALLAGTGFDGTSSGQLKVVTLGSTDLSTVASGTVLSINSAVDQTGDGWTVGQIATTLSATGAGTALVGLQDGFYTVAMYSDTSADADAHLFNIIVDGGDSLDFAWTTATGQDHDHIEYIGTLSGIGADTLTADNFI